MLLQRWIRLWGLESIVGPMWMLLRLGFLRGMSRKDMGFWSQERDTKSMDKEPCVIYSKCLDSLTKMSWNNSSCYFLRTVQTCIDWNLALQIKTRLLVGDDKTYGALLSLSALMQRFAYVIIQLRIKKGNKRKKNSLQETLKLSCPEENISLSSPSEPWLLTLLLPWETSSTISASSGFQ